MTRKQVAEFYEVEENTVKLCYQRNKAEIDEDGTLILCKDSLKVHNVPFKNIDQL